MTYTSPRHKPDSFGLALLDNKPKRAKKELKSMGYEILGYVGSEFPERRSIVVTLENNKVLVYDGKEVIEAIEWRNYWLSKRK